MRYAAAERIEDMRAAETEMQQTLKLIAAVFHWLDRRFENLRKILENYNLTAGIKELAKAIKDKNAVVYYVRGEGLDAAVKKKMLQAGIAFIPEKDADGREALVVSRGSLDRINEINDQCLIEQSMFYQAVGGKRMEDVLARDKGFKNKGIFELDGLSFYDMECLKNKCNDISKGFTVGIDKNEDDTYRVVLRQSKVFEINPKKTDFCEAAARYVMSLYGPNRETKMKQIDDDSRTDLEISKKRDEKKEFWVVSQDRTDQYIHFFPSYDEDHNITGYQFEYQERKADKELNRDNQKSSGYECMSMHDDSEKTFDVEFIRAADRLKNKVIITDPTQFAEHLNTPEKKYQTDRTEKTIHQAVVSEGEKMLTNKINTMIKTTAFKEKEKLSAKEAFDRYRKNYVEIMEALKEGKVPDGYNEADMQELATIVYNQDMKLDDYKFAMQKFATLDIDARDAKAYSKEKVEESEKNLDSVIRKDSLKDRDNSKTDRKNKSDHDDKGDDEMEHDHVL